MRFFDYIFIAFLSIRRQKLRSALTIFAVVIGATSVTIMLSVVFSVKTFITNQFEQNGTFQQVAVAPQTDITWNDRGGGQCSDCTTLTDALVARILARPHVAGVARQVQLWQFEALLYSNQKLRIQQLIAYDTNGVIVDHLLAGRDLTAADRAGIVTVSSDYADKLGFKNNYQALIGKQVSLYTSQYYTGVGSDPAKMYQDQQTWFAAHPGASGQDYHPAPVFVSATIVGVTDASLMSNYTIRVPLDWARGMYETQNYQTVAGQQRPLLVTTDELAKNGYTSLIVKADKASDAAGVASDLRHTFNVGAADAQTEIKQQLALFNILGYVLGSIGGIALIVAAVGVVNTMIMSILERTREIGVMRAVGARRAAISRLFTFEAALLGLSGGVFGVAAGYALTLIGNPILNKQLRSNNIGSTNILTLPWWLIIGVILLTTVIGILAGLYPARRAAHLNPVDALHYE
ncbi:MAG TPA: FtsX-like permease family protein [Candidatus Saccharimonadales bacterium]|nr:FtsX-like permease family protein [Candidatus Saccharimonadales bacterium]